MLAVGALGGLDKADIVGFYQGKKSLAEDFEAAAIIPLVLPMAIAVIRVRIQSAR